MSGAVNFSMGCHSGYNVHDGHATTGYQLDYPQALAQKESWWIGNTGFGYGMSDSVALTERLMHLFARELTSQASMPVGQALAQAKQAYLSEAPSGGFGTYDEKVLIESTLYGLPMYEVSVPSPDPWSQQSTETRTQVGIHATGVYSVLKTLSVTYDPVVTTDDGSYYAIDALAQSNPGRPIQPKTSIALDTVPDLDPHGVLLLGGEATETDFDPLIAHPVPTSTEGLEEPGFGASSWFPSKMFAINLLGAEDRLVVVPAQFLGDQDGGTLRRFTELVFTVTYSDSVDYVPPVVWEVESLLAGETTTFKVSVDDASGIERVLVTYCADGQNWSSANLTYSAYTGRWEGSVTGLTEEASYFVQVMDGAGNVTISNNKGEYFSPETHNIYLPLVLRNF
jgi:hypothetical protein